MPLSASDKVELEEIERMAGGASPVGESARAFARAILETRPPSPARSQAMIRLRDTILYAMWGSGYTATGSHEEKPEENI